MLVINRRENIKLAVCLIQLCMLDKKGLFLSPYTLNVFIFLISFSLIHPANVRRV